MSAVAPTLEAFFTQRLMSQKRASRHTIAAYRDGFRLLLAFAHDRSELTGLKRQDIHLGAGPHVRYHGKGRKDRATPLTAQTVKVMRTWLAELSPDPAGPLFPAQPGGRLSRDTKLSGAPSGTLRTLAACSRARMAIACSRSSMPGPPAKPTAASTSGTNCRR